MRSATAAFVAFGAATLFATLLALDLRGSADVDVEISDTDKVALKEKAREMFMHGYVGYLRHAFPHDELRPLACRPRIRGITPSRGDVDDSLGNFSLTLVDAMDTLVVMGEMEEFERAVLAVVNGVRFDADLVVSVFETNIRMVGGLISAHILTRVVREAEPHRLTWYDDQLLRQAVDLADRLLPAFNTTSGVPHSRINLRHGLQPDLLAQSHTCTACAGTIILEWAALSRLSGNPIYEQKARRAMDFLWNQRNHGSDLMGTVLNVESGDWVRRDAGIGAGIDSYYEYTLKAYILLGEEDFLRRFNRHYDAVMRYLSKGPLFIDVHMHRPNVASRSYMDSLLAFWPGLQVLKGDLRGAMESHEMLYQVIKKHKFLPEAFTHDLQIHWAQHPLRPEFLESTYLLYRATKDPHYLSVAARVMESIDAHCRTDCGFASVKDIRTMEMLDEMESFVLSETFKYLYMIFAEPADLPFDPDNYVLTTEAHFIPLSIGEQQSADALPRRLLIDPDEIVDDDASARFQNACPNPKAQHRTLDELSAFGGSVRANVQKLLAEFTSLGSYVALLASGGGSAATPGNEQTLSTAEIRQKANDRLRAWAFSSSNPEHIQRLKQMGIRVQVMPDGRMSLTHMPQEADSPLSALHGADFMQEMLELTKKLESQSQNLPQLHNIQLVSFPELGLPSLMASPAHFGADLHDFELIGELGITEPIKGCTGIKNPEELRGRIAVVSRGECMFEEKARQVEAAGAVGMLVFDNQPNTSAADTPAFAMSGERAADGTPTENGDVEIPALFLFSREAQQLMQYLAKPNRAAPLKIRMSTMTVSPQSILVDFLRPNAERWPTADVQCII